MQKTSTNTGIPRRMPSPEFTTTTSPRSVGELYNGAMSFKKDPEAIAKQYPWADRFVCGMPLAPWQRPVVWNDQMQKKFIDALWMNVDTGSYMVNAWWELVDKNSHVMAYLSDVVIDGQQRLTSIERYLNDEIPADSADGTPLLWSEITRFDQLAFKNKLFPRTEISTNDETWLREAYDIRAFAGIRHTEDQRALPVPDASKAPFY